MHYAAQQQAQQPQQQLMPGQNQSFTFEQLAQAANNNAAQKVCPDVLAQVLRSQAYAVAFCRLRLQIVMKFILSQIGAVM